MSPRSRCRGALAASHGGRDADPLWQRALYTLGAGEAFLGLGFQVSCLHCQRGEEMEAGACPAPDTAGEGEAAPGGLEPSLSNTLLVNTLLPCACCG